MIGIQFKKNGELIMKKVRDEVLIAILRLEPDILQCDNLKFRLGNAANCTVVFKYGVIEIDRDDLVILGLNRSIPKDLAVRLIDAITQHCINKKKNLVVVPLDKNGEPADAGQRR